MFTTKQELGVNMWHEPIVFFASCVSYKSKKKVNAGNANPIFSNTRREREYGNVKLYVRGAWSVDSR